MKSAATTRWLVAAAVCCLCILQAAPVSARARSSESSSALAKPEAPANAGGPPYGPPPDRPALLQPLQYDTKAAPFQSQQKAVALLKEMNQKWEGMEDPLGANNPWDSVSSHGNQARAFEGPSTKVGTPTDPYTGMFGPWRHPPRAVPPPPMVKTFIFDPNHPFRRQMPEPPNPTNPSSNVAPKLNLWHPITNLTYYDTTKIPRVVLPIPRPEARRPNYRDPYGVPGRKPQDWLYERIPATPRIVRPQRMGLLRDVPIDHMYPKYHILNPRSAFTRPTHSRGDPLKHSEGFHRFTTRQPEAPKSAPTAITSAPRFTTRMPTHDLSAEEMFAPSRFPPPPNAHPLRMPPQSDLAIDPSSLIEQNARVMRRKAASSAGARVSTRMARALRPAPRRMGPPLPKDIDRVEREEALVELNEKLALSAALRSKLKHGKPLMVNPTTVAHQTHLLEAEKATPALSLVEEQASVTDRDELTASAAVKVGTAADAAASVSVETDVVSRPANEVRPASAPALLQYEVALVPKQGPPAPEQQAAPGPAASQPDQTQLTLAEIGARLSLQQEAAQRTKEAIAASKPSAAQETVFTETDAKITAEAGAETEVDEGAQDLVSQHQQRVQREKEEEEQRKAAAWEASPASKVAWWDRADSVKENEERASKFVEVGSSVDNREAPNFVPSTDQLAIGQTDPSFATPAGPSSLMELSSSSPAPASSSPSFIESQSQSLSATELASVSASNSLNAYSAPDFRSYQHTEATPSAPTPAAQSPMPQPGLPTNTPFAMPQQQPTPPPMFLQQAASANAYPLANNAFPAPVAAPFNANQPLSLANLPPQVTALLAHSQTLTPAQPTNIFIVQTPPASQQSDFSVRQERSLPPIVLA